MGRKTKENLGMIFRIFIGVLYITPLILSVIYSFHPDENFMKLGTKLFPDNMTLDNYRYVFKNIPVWTYFKNTFVIVIVSIPLWVLITSFGAYAFSYFNYPLKKFMYAFLLTAFMIPSEVTFIVNYLTIHRLDLINTYVALCIPQIASVGAVIMLRQNMLAVPIGLWEAARMDGCGKMRYFFYIMLPMCKALLTANVITHFIGIYNSYFWPLMVTTRDEWHTIQIGVRHLLLGNGLGVTFAGGTMSVIIPLILYLVNQKRIVEGMSAGAVKG